MYKSLFFLLIFWFYHYIYILLGFIFYYVFRLRNLGHYLISAGLAPMFGFPKKLHNWLYLHCPFNSYDVKCRRWTCPNYSKCGKINKNNLYKIVQNVEFKKKY